MKFALSALALAAAFALTASGSAEAAKKVYAKPSKPLTGIIYGNQRRPGGYSYKYSDVITPGSRTNPAVTGLYPSGPLDGDFFYATPHGPFGGYTPYMH